MTNNIKKKKRKEKWNLFAFTHSLPVVKIIQIYY